MIIKKLISENFDKSRNGHKPLIICIHIVGLPAGTANSAYQEFLRPGSNKSSHYLCLKDGTIWNFVDEQNTAYGNGIINNPTNEIVQMYHSLNISINEISISIEHEGTELADITLEQYKATSDLVRDICTRWSIPIDRRHIIRHNEIRKDKSCPGKVDVGKIVRMALQAPQPVPPIQPTQNYNTTSMPDWLWIFLKNFKRQ